MNRNNQSYQTPWCISAFAVVFLTGCYQDQTRSGLNDQLFAADAAAKERVQLEVQADELIIDTDTEPGIAESDPFELKDYPTYSIWPRIRAGFQIHTHLDHPRVQAQLEWY
ncbi:MAG: hypothetical protein HKP12_16370, partial [Gammaproteobacteria bacterium]|nr:hypothetical protein [Gammaproteobacteria bacterium]